MGNRENLSFKEAIGKIKELVSAADICMFTTALTQLPLSARPMSTQQTDDEGNLWFFSEKDSDKNDHIHLDNRVQLFYANKSNYEFFKQTMTGRIACGEPPDVPPFKAKALFNIGGCVKQPTM